MKTIRSNKKGFGIHSPFAYHLVTSVLFSDAQFYAFDEIDQLPKGKVEKRLLKLVFRLLNYFNPERVVYLDDVGEVELEMLRKGVKEIKFEVAKTPDDVLRISLKDSPFVILNVDLITEHVSLPEINAVWFVKSKNKKEDRSRIIESLTEKENGILVFKLENAEIIIFDSKFTSQNYVIK